MGKEKKRNRISKWQIALIVLFAILVITIIGIPKHKVDYLEGGATYTTDIKDNKPEPQPEQTPASHPTDFSSNNTAEMMVLTSIFESMGNFLPVGIIIVVMIIILMIVFKIISSTINGNTFTGSNFYSPILPPPAIIFLGVLILCGVSLLSIIKSNPVKWGAGI